MSWVTTLWVICTGPSKRRNSSTAGPTSSGARRSRASCSGLRSSARVPLPIRFTVVSCPATSRSWTRRHDLARRDAVALGVHGGQGGERGRRLALPAARCQQIAEIAPQVRRGLPRWWPRWPACAAPKDRPSGRYRATSSVNMRLVLGWHAEQGADHTHGQGIGESLHEVDRSASLPLWRRPVRSRSPGSWHAARRCAAA